MSDKRQRRHFRGQKKMAILRRHFVDKVPVWQRCEQQRIHPTLFYGWQKVRFDNGAAVFDGPRQRNGRQEDAAANRIEALTNKLRRKAEGPPGRDEVLSELMEEHVALKEV